MKTYTYEKKFFNTEVKMVGIICVILALLAIVMMAINFLTWIFLVVFIVAVYQVINTYFTNSNPEIITISDEEISLSSFKRKDTYKLDEIYSFKVRELGGNKFYVRINKSTLLKGRYWIQAYRMNDTLELKNWINDFEMKVHPDSLKAQAINSSKKYKAIKEREKKNASTNNK